MFSYYLEAGEEIQAGREEAYVVCSGSRVCKFYAENGDMCMKATERSPGRRKCMK